MSFRLKIFYRTVVLHFVDCKYEKNRDSIIGLVFLKFAGDKFESRLTLSKVDNKFLLSTAKIFLSQKKFSFIRLESIICFSDKAHRIQTNIGTKLKVHISTIRDLLASLFQVNRCERLKNTTTVASMNVLPTSKLTLAKSR